MNRLHLPRLISLHALAAMALGVAVAFATLPLAAQSNPFEKIFGPKKTQDPPPKKKKKSTTTAKKKSTDAAEAEAKPSPTPRKKGSASTASAGKTTNSAGQAKPKSTAQKKSSTDDDAEDLPRPTPRKKSGASTATAGSTKGVTDQTKVKAKIAATSKPIPAPTPEPEPSPAVSTSASGESQTSSIESSELKEFAAQPERVRQLLELALALTRRNLTYTYGSADPSRGGMDCSGFIYHTLKEAGFADVPRQSNEQYIWVRKKSIIWAVLSQRSDTFEINELQPGDLMFWTGTYAIDRDPPITHTMIYLGTSKKTGKRLMVGSSDGRTYQGVKRNGVSVFDFHVESSAQKNGATTNGRTPDFSGYGPIPGMR